MGHKVDTNAGLNADQSGPIEKIQNGDPKAGANRDQRSGAAESGGPGPSLQTGPTGTEGGQVPPHEGLTVHDKRVADAAKFPDQLPAGALDRGGKADYEDAEKLSDVTGKQEGATKTTIDGEAEGKDSVEKRDLKGDAVKVNKDEDKGSLDKNKQGSASK